MNRFAIAVASVAIGASFAFAVPSAHAATKVDCDAVMQALNGGKKPADVAKDMSISRSSVYRCKRHAMAAAKASEKTMRAHNPSAAESGMGGAAMPSAAASPAGH